MLPNDGDLTDAQRRQAMDNFARYLRAQNLTAADVARQLGKPKATTIGELLSHKWRDGSDEHIRKLNMWVEQHARQRAAQLSDKFVTTLRVAKSLFGVARLVHENATMGLAVGPSGIGKSRCAIALHEKYVGSIYIRIINGYHHAKGITMALAGALRVRSTKSRISDQQHQTQLESVIAILQNSHRMLFIDEAHKLENRAIEVLRDIHDCAGVPVLLLATQDLKDRIERDATPDKGQIYSRFDVTYPLTEGFDVADGGKPLHTMDDIRALYNEPSLKLSPDAGRYLLQVANALGEGSLRRCKRLVQNGARRARRRQNVASGERVTVTADDLAFADQSLRPSRTQADARKERYQRAVATGTAG